MLLTKFKIIFQFTSLACLATVLFAGISERTLFSSVTNEQTDNSKLFRALTFICIFNLLFTLFVLFLHISHMYMLIPWNFGKIVSNNH